MLWWWWWTRLSRRIETFQTFNLKRARKKKKEKELVLLYDYLFSNPSGLSLSLDSRCQTRDPLKVSLSLEPLIFTRGKQVRKARQTPRYIYTVVQTLLVDVIIGFVITHRERVRPLSHKSKLLTSLSPGPIYSKSYITNF